MIKTQKLKAVRCQFSLSPQVGFEAIHMTHSIHFNHKPQFRAIAIDDVAVQWSLAVEAVSKKLFSAQTRP